MVIPSDSNKHLYQNYAQFLKLVKFPPKTKESCVVFAFLFGPRRTAVEIFAKKAGSRRTAEKRTGGADHVDGRCIEVCNGAVFFETANMDQLLSNVNSIELLHIKYYQVCLDRYQQNKTTCGTCRGSFEI